MVLQEVSESILDSLVGQGQGVLSSSHDYIHDDLDETNPNSSSDMISWKTESNIIWNKNLFHCSAHGFESLHLVDNPHRGVFWCRLTVISTSVEFLVATCHLPWAGSGLEIRTGVNQRIGSTHAVAAIVRRLKASPEEMVVLAGDFNDDFHPLRYWQLLLLFLLPSSLCTHTHIVDNDVLMYFSPHLLLNIPPVMLI